MENQEFDNRFAMDAVPPTPSKGRDYDLDKPDAPAAPEEKQKTVKRGLGTARGTSRMKFSHENALQNGLFLGHLDSVALNIIRIGEDKTGLPSFNGLEVPRLVLTFASNEDDPNKRKYQNLSFTAVESNVNTIPGGKEEWKVNAVFNWMKHILDVYILKGRDLTEEQSNAFSLPFTDFDSNGDYVPVEPEEVLAGWKVLFEHMENALNRGNNGQPYYKVNGKNIPVWMKLLRYVKSRKGWQAVSNGDLAFPTFVGEGCIEVFKQGVPPSIRLDSVKEAIIPMNVDKPKAPNLAPGIGGAGPMASGVPVGDYFGANSSFGNIASEAAEDLPF